MATVGEPQTFRTVWKYDPADVPTPVNQFFFQVGVPAFETQASGEVVMTLGWTNPPVMLPASDNSVNIVGIENNELPVAVVGHFQLSASRLIELSTTLSDFVATHLRGARS